MVLSPFYCKKRCFKKRFFSYFFVVCSNKFQIKDMVEKLYGVKVVNVNTCVVRGKNKARYTKSGLLRGKTDRWKKAFVTVGEGETIDFYSNI